jgi:adhesin transport system membrane fusion protein
MKLVIDGRWFHRFGRMLLRRRPPRPGELPLHATAHPASGWEAESSWAMLEQEPVRARAVTYVSASVVLALLAWAALAPIDEVTRGQARVVPTMQLQVAQSVDGGVVAELLVKEGDEVEAGQLLLRVDATRFKSSMLESRAAVRALEVKRLRLEALTRGEPFRPTPELVREVPDIVSQEQRLYESRQQELRAQLGVVQNQLAQRHQELNEVRARRQQAERGLELATRELDATRPMIASGAVSEVEVMRLEREVSRLRGDREQLGAQILRVQAGIGEANRRMDEVQLTARNEMSAELSDTMSKLSTLSEGGVALEDRVKHAEIKSPVRGTVKRLLVNTVGAVVPSGKELVEIVPLDDALILEAQILPKDIAFLRPGQEATVKFTAYDYSIYGGLEGRVIGIGADSVADSKGNAYYMVRIRTDRASLGKDLPIIPGMVAQVDILTGKKTVLAYLMKPVLRASANALRER